MKIDVATRRRQKRLETRVAVAKRRRQKKVASLIASVEWYIATLRGEAVTPESVTLIAQMTILRALLTLPPLSVPARSKRKVKRR